MREWLVERFGQDVLPWVFIPASIMVIVVGLVGSIIFSVVGFGIGLNVSMPMMIVGILSGIVSLMVLG